eukprot:Nitzschia sp. Nitz4//scaffold48_size128905//10034//11193//NITZ4_003577-RA/size128905-augustus-gene-0.15-mRNA-1//-1//CDS//3329552913//4105//frame0
MTTASPAAGPGGLMSSIVALKQLLNDHSTEGQGLLAKELHDLQQARFDDQQRFQRDMQTQEEVVNEMKRRLEQAKKEFEQEKAIRSSLQEAHDSLKQRNKALMEQVTSLENADGSTSAKVEHVLDALSQSNKKVESLEQSASMWKEQFEASQREIQALKQELAMLKNTSSTSATTDPAAIGKRASVADHEIMEEGLLAMTTVHEKDLGKDSSSTLRLRVPADIERQILELTSQKKKLANLEHDILGESGENTSGWKTQYKNAELARQTAEAELSKVQAELKESTERLRSLQDGQRATEIPGDGNSNNSKRPAGSETSDSPQKKTPRNE